MALIRTRRDFLGGIAAASAVGLAQPSGPRASEGVLETTTIRLQRPALCATPLYIADELLRAEGFTEIRYVDDPPGVPPLTNADFGPFYASQSVSAIDAGEPVILLAGVMVGCFELFAREGIGSIAELRGKSVGRQALGSTNEVLLRIMAAQVGLDPAKDLHWVQSLRPTDLFIEGKIDAFLAAPPDLQEVRARNIGHVIVSSITDRPWSQYYCCMLATSTEFAGKYPVATKRVLRAILKGADLCASDPKRAARLLVDRGYAKRYDYALQALSEILYDVWRDYDPEDTFRFYALRLQEAGLIKSSPNKLIAGHSDWRFLDELKRELKA